ncbi:Replication factor C subunit 3 [Beauveria bassiana]|uniref:Replication factor C subunit 3 n=1 Tax=Beauveria bassiana TaxID=176275 RepID=A0A2N6NWN8_BEABA|nr:Replication factor C subunit 3 [Beauveria bassiana]
MSDFGDEMDVDSAPAQNKDVVFSADASKGKRSTANLPVEAEDTLPWIEKYRPESLDDVEGHQDILATINKFVDANRLPHLLLYGPPGTGKTSTILALARRIYGAAHVRQMVLELNASDDRGIDVVREQIKTFASTKQIFGMGAPRSGTSSSSSSSPAAGFKLIILDEADAMTSTAQMALRRIMEKYTANTRFCIIANYAHKLSPALLSRCTRFRFSPLKEADIRQLVTRVVDEEGVRIGAEAVDALVKLSKGDMRRALNVLQACHASSTPLRAPGAPKTPDSEIRRENITTETIYTCIAAPAPEAIEQIMTTLLGTSDVTSCLHAISSIKRLQGLALADVITALADELAKLDVSPAVMITWLDGLAEIEHRVAGGGSEVLQTGAVVGVVRTGVELMSRLLLHPWLRLDILVLHLDALQYGPVIELPLFHPHVLFLHPLLRLTRNPFLTSLVKSVQAVAPLLLRPPLHDERKVLRIRKAKLACHFAKLSQSDIFRRIVHAVQRIHIGALALHVVLPRSHGGAARDLLLNLGGADDLGIVVRVLDTCGCENGLNRIAPTRCGYSTILLGGLVFRCEKRRELSDTVVVVALFGFDRDEVVVVFGRLIHVHFCECHADFGLCNIGLVDNVT